MVDRGKREWRRVVVAMAVLGWLGLGASAQAHVELEASLDSEQEVPTPAVGSPAPTGETEIEIEEPEAGTMLSYSITVQNLSGPAIAAHIHPGAPGVAGAPLFTLDHTTLAGTVGPLSETQLETLLNGGFYVNVHTAANPDGEIRGQIALKKSADTCLCKTAATPKAFKACVRKAIKALPKDERQSDPVKALKKNFGKAACGRTKGPKKAIACCLPQTPIANIVIGELCAAVPEAACTRLGGTSLGAGSSCFANGKFQNPCLPPASPSGAFLDAAAAGF